LIPKLVSGAYKGSLSALRAHEIGSMVIKEALNRAKVQPEEVSEVIMGQVQLFSLKV
jgi:acetyl-CoA C-acetyltransferase